MTSILDLILGPMKSRFVSYHVCS